MDFWPGIIGWGYRSQKTAGEEIAEIIGTDLPGALDGWWMSAWETYLTFIDNHVSVASDLSGNGNDAIQNSSTLRPIVTTEGFARTVISDSVNLELPTEIGNIIKNSNYAIAMEFYTEGNEDIAFAPIITTDEDSSIVDALTILNTQSLKVIRGINHNSVSQRALPTAVYYATLVSFNGRLWAYGGRLGSSTYTNTIYVSDNGGSSWTSMGNAAWEGRAYHAIAKQGSKLVLVGGYAGATIYDDEWTSDDGYTWVETTGPMAFGPRGTTRLLPMGNNLVLLGGGTTGGSRSVWVRDISGSWSVIAATDGTFSTGEIRWAVFDNTIYVVSGNGTSVSDDVWRLDGTVWTLVTSIAGFEARRLAAVWSDLEKLYIAFGYGASTLQDIWCSSDGYSWSQINSSTGFNIFGSFTCVHNGIAYVTREDAQGYYVMCSEPTNITATSADTYRKSIVLIADGYTRTVYKTISLSLHIVVYKWDCRFSW
jgi:hypothetical protein